ncbi:Lysine--tRNA ligase [bioreactor metagenome]|uniref:Lysine--tRNA ligase n=1 Tax=bioreactor metagenome TaxID=1076179 RepID=A0A644U2N2_9ZZZZ|nr:lysine--tRNA ligase [Methanocorpusculum sp.]
MEEKIHEKIHWADAKASQVPSDVPQLIATGITPSGPIHLGNMREVMTGDMIYKALLSRGVEAELVYIADDFDPLRKVYPFLSDEYQKYIGWPVSDIPCPCGKHKSYAEHFLDPFLSAIEELDIHPRIIRTSEAYRSGMFTEQIKEALIHAEDIKKILEDVSGRKLEEGWTPYYPICSACGTISRAAILSHDSENHTVTYKCPCGHEGVSDYSKGEGKLVWRVDWPMRWSVHGVTVEPFGKDHASPGGSYDTGKIITKEIYGYEAPVPVTYEWISLKGKGEMHSSKGVVLTIRDMLDIVAPEVLRYLIAKTKPDKTIAFDPGMGLLRLIDEYDKAAAAGESREFELSRIASPQTTIPFRHMVTVVQIARTDDAVFDILRRSGYEIVDKEAVLDQANRAKVWLERYAPDDAKFALAESLPEIAAGERTEVKAAVAAYAKLIVGAEWKADVLHNAVYDAAQAAGVTGKDVFTGIYRAFLGADRGPRLGWFLEALGREETMKRLLEMSL